MLCALYCRSLKLDQPPSLDYRQLLVRSKIRSNNHTRSVDNKWSNDCYLLTQPSHLGFMISNDSRSALICCILTSILALRSRYLELPLTSVFSVVMEGSAGRKFRTIVFGKMPFIFCRTIVFPELENLLADEIRCSLTRCTNGFSLCDAEIGRI
ncbi:hypothetical protein J3R30DRAFT_3467957 [Lentinula aciculospora]|uniref:Uncharacterized protein n=1 Tax=Lentinula aciculospora TaxID=153920 RepID=A0A9W9DPZ1_9AGAR|nr:hypothetical protein J3R30DRAFT_3467957 [Lentinula aciculospora]